MDYIFSRKERRKELRNAVKEAKKIQNKAKQIIEERSIDGRVEIPVKAENLYNSLSMGDFKQLNSFIFSYVEDCANLLPPPVPLRIVMHNVKKEEREGVEELFKFHYRLKIQDLLWDQKITCVKAVSLFVLGAIFILAYFYFALYRDDTLFTEILSVIGSFGLSGAITCLLTDIPTLQNSMIEYSHFLTAEVTFTDEEQ